MENQTKQNDSKEGLYLTYEGLKQDVITLITVERVSGLYLTYEGLKPLQIPNGLSQIMEFVSYL